MSKTTLRRDALRLRRSLSQRYVEDMSIHVIASVLGAVDWTAINSVHMYTSASELREVVTLPLHRQLIEVNPNIAINTSDISKNAAIPPGEYDAVIVPLLAFDSECHRLGLGGGWYDRFLATQPQAHKIGLAFEVQRVNAVPIEPHDIQLDMIITEVDIYRKQKHPTEVG